MEKYEIWLGYYHLGQGYGASSKPEKVAEIEATSFKVACLIYELESKLKWIKEEMDREDPYIEDIHFGEWYYNGTTNSNSWTGKYYETYTDALRSFNRN